MKKAGNKTTVYVRDASGNVLSVYERPPLERIRQSEVHLYGSSRLGILGELTTAPTTVTLEGGYGTAQLSTFTRGEKFFELSNHLGNVLATITDKKLQHPDGSGGIDYYNADIATANDYYPFGMLMPGRKYAADDLYRYGFNGQERSTEIDPNGNSMTAEFWQYDARIGRRWNVDPILKEYESPYAAFSDNPIWFSDPNGSDTTKPVGFSERFTKLLMDNQSGQMQVDIVKGSLNAGKDGVVDIWNFVTRDVARASTYNNFVSLVMVGSTRVSAERRYVDMVFGLHSQAAYEALKDKADVSKWSTEEWSYNITYGLLTIFGPKIVKGGIGKINTVAASTYLKYAYGGRYATAAEPGTARFTLKLGLSENYIYHSNTDRAITGKWSSSTNFANSDDAFNALGLDYPGTRNFAQKVFTSRSVGVYVESQAARMGSTPGGASQLLKTKLSYTYGVEEMYRPSFSLRTAYRWRGLYVISHK